MKELKFKAATMSSGEVHQSAKEGEREGDHVQRQFCRNTRVSSAKDMKDYKKQMKIVNVENEIPYQSFIYKGP